MPGQSLWLARPVTGPGRGSARIAAWLGILALALGLAAADDAQARELPDFTRLVQRYGPAVVNISTIRHRIPVAADLDAPRAPGGSPRRRPYNDLPPYWEEPPEGLDTQSLGSGFIISPDGYILTCQHVVENASEIVVKLTDRREYLARLVGADRRSDVALLKIDATGLPTVALGRSANLRVGDWVLAIGSPFGFENSATAGIVSAKGRSLPAESYVPFIQTDVPINPGNSGGPLFNLEGQVIGINSEIYSRTGGYMGLSFAIPIDVALRVSAQLKHGGRVQRGWIGIAIQEVNRDLAAAFGLGEPRGALIDDILPGSPAARSGLRAGDVVLAYQGRPIVRSSELPLLVGITPPGTRVHLRVFRGGQILTVAVTTGKLEDRAPGPAARPAVPAAGDRFGLSLRDLSAAERHDLGLSRGVRVDAVAAGPADLAGIRPGDVILQVDGRGVDNTAAFYRLMAQVPSGRPAAVRLRRDGLALFVALPASL